MPRRVGVWVSLLLALGACARDTDPAPHLVLVVIDTLRRDHVGAYGHPRATTPFLDQLGADGVVFENAYAQASQTLVSTATLMTSRHFPYLGEPRGPSSERLSILEANRTVAEVLSDGGYWTMGVFTNPHHYPESGFWQGFVDAVYLKPDDSGPKWYADAQRVRTAFREGLERRDSAEPLFAYLHFMDPHDPWMPPPAVLAQFETVERPTDFGTLRPHREQEGKGGPTAEALVYLKGLYDAEIHYVDETIAGVVADMKRAGLWDDSVLLVASDHGEGFMEHGVLGHGTSHEKELVFVPLIVHGAGTPGRRVDALVRNLDLAPTLLELARLRVPESFEGKSLVALFSGDKGDDRDTEPAYGWYREFRSLTTPEWHLTWNRKTGQRRLYDNAADAAGLHDVAASQPEVLRLLAEQALAYEQAHEQADAAARRHRESETGERDGGLDPEIEEQLRQLGYL